MAKPPYLLSLLHLIILPFIAHSLTSPPPTVCIVGSGISGASVSHFLRKYSDKSPITVGNIRIFERNAVVGGRMATLTIAGDTFEAGASIIHPKNYHTSNFTSYLKLKKRFGISDGSDGGDGYDDDGDSLGFWNGEKFVFKTMRLDSRFRIVNKAISLVNQAKIFWRYGVSLFKMQAFVEHTLSNFLKYYESHDTRPVFHRAEEMLKWSGLYDPTTRTLEEELVDAGLSPLLINELVTVITRINYGQSTRMSGLAGGVSLAGSGGGLWAVVGGNWQMAAGLINNSDVELHLNEEIQSVTRVGTHYELSSSKGNNYICQVTVFATPLDELDVKFDPPISVPERKMQHTYTTFIKGLLNPAYFGLRKVAEIPDLVGTLENPDIPFSCISVLKRHKGGDITYKMFSRKPLDDTLLDQIFRTRKETIRINWAAYPHYKPPEAFAPFILDEQHLYYVNAFESAASAMETGAVSAENIARLILSRLSNKVDLMTSIFEVGSVLTDPHSDL
ncbi:hypothetical protein RND81_04G211000 [Saponaria officinalis]|uniref:Prenylcysteine lyase domain-containing protein n=1 Tax=Saponaria officinalis TaxID=3572 RepID=A0AAW1LN56_SAPOF